jgi:hypothetical protein
MIIPSMVKLLRSLFASNVVVAILKLSRIFMLLTRLVAWVVGLGEGH